MGRMPKVTDWHVWDTAGHCHRHDKILFVTRRAARKAARRLRATHGRMNAYRCGDCWHIGHLPTAVRNGRLSRDDLEQQDGAQDE